MKAGVGRRAMDCFFGHRQELIGCLLMAVMLLVEMGKVWRLTSSITD